MRIPNGVEIRLIGDKAVYVTGRRGNLKAIVEGVKINGDQITTETVEGREMIRRMIQGVTEGYKGRVKIIGVGYRATQDGEKVKLAIGQRDDKVVKISAGVKMEITGNGTIITGRSNRNDEIQGLMGLIREQRAARKDKYKGKGIK